MSTEDQLEWEARLRRPVAFAAFGAAVLGIASLVARQSIFENRPDIRATPDSLLSIDASPDTLIASAALYALASLLLIPVFVYLFRATIHRTPTIPRWFVYLVFIGPVLFAAAQFIGAFDQIDLAEKFADGDYSFSDADPDEDPNLRECPAVRGELGDACADELIQQEQGGNGALVIASLLGPVLVAFLFVMLPLRARRAGLLSPFMSVLGLLSGVLLVLPLVPPVVLQAFWLGALGALVLGKWPGGRGPAWESGEAAPWPTPAQRRGLVGQGDDGAPDEAAVEPADAAEAQASGEREPAPERPSSRKRKRRRR